MSDDFAKPDLAHLKVVDAVTATAPTIYKVHPYTVADRQRAAKQRGRGAFSFAAQPMTEEHMRRLPPEHREAPGPDFENLCEVVVKELRSEGKWQDPPKQCAAKKKGKAHNAQVER